jgi:membrane-associated phospholipid phosphatase
VWWLTAAVLLVSLTVGFFVGGLRGPGIAVTDADDEVVAWLAGVNAPGLLPTMRTVAELSSWPAVNVLLWGLLLTLLILLIQYEVAPLVQRSRPFGVEFRTDWTAWALPSELVAALVVTLMGLVYGLVPEGRWRQRGKWIATGLVAMVGLARVYLGVEAPTDVLVAVAVGVAVSLLGFRLFTPNEIFPVTYRRGRGAHLDVEGARGIAIRRALDDQLGVLVDEVTPFGLAGSAGSTPLRITLTGDPPAGCSGSSMPGATCAPTAGTSWVANCSTAGSRTRGHSTPCAGWSSRRTTRCR